jgi:hypothetical protein
MALLFDPALGRVSQFIPREQLQSIAVTFPGFDYAQLQVITSSVALSLKPVWQANDTLGDDIYLISFGESLTALPLSGLVFADACTFAGPTGRDGLLLLLQWWQRNNLLKRRQPVSLTLGSNYAVKAFVTDLNLSIANAEDGIWKFEMLMLRIPERVLSNDELGAAQDQLVQATPLQPAAMDANAGTVLTSASPAASLPSYDAPVVNVDGGSPAPLNVLITPSGYPAAGRLLGPITARG